MDDEHLPDWYIWFLLAGIIWALFSVTQTFLFPSEESRSYSIEEEMMEGNTRGSGIYEY